MNIKLNDIAPLLCRELEKGFAAENLPDFGAQVPELVLNSWTYDDEANAIYVSVKGGRTLNAVEKNIIGAKLAESIALDSVDGIVVVDVDNFDRIRGIEVINREDVLAELRAHRGMMNVNDQIAL